MEILRTPDECFENLPGWDLEPRYHDIGGLRLHWIDEGPPSGPTVVLLHGEPTWGFLYRKMIPTVVAAGCRVVVPDLVGFGRSDKPAHREDYTYARHVEWMRSLLFTRLNLSGVTLVCQDWGGLIGLRLVAEHAHRFARVVAANTSLPLGDEPPSDAFMAWRQYSQSAPELRPGAIVQRALVTECSPEVVAAYDAPFPDETYKSGARQFPMLVPLSPDDPAAAANRDAWDALGRFERPFLTAFSDSDPIFRGLDAELRRHIPGAESQPHITIEGAGHFLQEDRGERLAEVVADFIRRTS